VTDGGGVRVVRSAAYCIVRRAVAERDQVIEYGATYSRRKGKNQQWEKHTPGVPSHAEPESAPGPHWTDHPAHHRVSQ
jgi:hypothetical protein